MNPDDVSIATLLRRFIVVSRTEMQALAKAMTIGNAAAVAELQPVIAVCGIYPSGQVVAYYLEPHAFTIMPTFEAFLDAVSLVADLAVILEESVVEEMAGAMPLQ